MLNLRDPALIADNPDHSPIPDTATRPELHISTVEPYYGSAFSTFSPNETDEESDLG